MKKASCCRSGLFVAVVSFAVMAPCPMDAVHAADRTLNIQKSVPFKSGLAVPPAVKAECELPGKLTEFTRRYSEKHYTTVKVLDNPSNKGPGHTLIMEISGVDSQAGGRFTGRKGVSIEGALWENGKIIGSFQATRYSGGGGGLVWKGTCSILGRDVKALGNDVAEWLKQPSMKARLGEAQ